MSKCPVPKGFKIPQLTNIWSKKLSTIGKEMPEVAFTLPKPNLEWGLKKMNKLTAPHQ